MVDRPPEDRPTPGASETDELLRELIPTEREPSKQSEEGSPLSADSARAETRPTPSDGSTTDQGADGSPAVLAGENETVLTADPLPASGFGAGAATDATKASASGRRWWLALIALLAFVVVAGGAFLLGRSVDGDEPSTGAAVDPAESDDTDVGAAPQATTDQITTEQPVGTADSAGVPATGTGTSLTLNLSDYRFTVDGVVPSDELKASIEERMGLVFADFGESNIVVDPEVEPPSWAEAAPSIVNAMVLLHEGTIEVTSDEVTVSGRALERDFDTLETRLSSDFGFPPFTVASSDIIDKPAPWVRAVASGDGTVTMTGELADEFMQSTIVDGARDIYGAENVIDETGVNPERHDRFLIMRFPSNLAAFKVFGEFDIRGENESFTAILRNGLVFDTLETELTAESQDRLKAVMFTLTRNPLPVGVIGHTDNVGSDEDNQTLSEARAASVAAFLVENGVQQDLITTEGRGETESVGDNSSEEGRALNRRVEITVGLEQ